MNKHLFLDLEDTVITPIVQGWRDFELINIGKIRAFIKEADPGTLNIFSFAIWDQANREAFATNGCQEAIERALGMKIGHVPTVDDHIIPACCKKLGIHRVDFMEMSSFWGKQLAFRMWAQSVFHDPIVADHVVLLDDVVEPEYSFFPNIGLEVVILNIDKDLLL